MRRPRAACARTFLLRAQRDAVRSSRFMRVCRSRPSSTAQTTVGATTRSPLASAAFSLSLATSARCESSPSSSILADQTVTRSTAGRSAIRSATELHRRGSCTSTAAHETRCCSDSRVPSGGRRERVAHTAESCGRSHGGSTTPDARNPAAPRTGEKTGTASHPSGVRSTITCQCTGERNPSAAVDFDRFRAAPLACLGLPGAP